MKLPLNQALLEAQLLYNYIDVTVSFPHSLTGRLALATLSPLFVDLYRRSSRFCYLEFDKKNNL